MAIWRRCSKRTCTNPRRCLEHVWFDVTYRGTRFRVPVNEFAIPRMDPKKQRPIESLEEATRAPTMVADETSFTPGDIMAALDAPPPVRPGVAVPHHAAGEDQQGGHQDVQVLHRGLEGVVDHGIGVRRVQEVAHPGVDQAGERAVPGCAPDRF